MAKISIPYHRQRTGYLCGPACLQMIFELFGIRLTQKKLSRLMKTTKERGTSHAEMIRAARKMGFRPIVKTRAKYSDVIKLLQKKIPVILNFIEPKDNESHYAIAVQADGREIIFNDPWNGPGFRMSRRDFENRWQNKKGHRGWLLGVAIK